jgi:Methionyl-tRNA formyltransferase
MNVLKIVYMGCVQFSYEGLRYLLELQRENVSIEIIGIVTREVSDFNSDFKSLRELAEQFSIPCFIAKGSDQDSLAKWLKNIQPDVVYCFGWSYLLKKEVLKIPRMGVVGYHPSLLPANRGRHPLIWALVLGLSETGSTFFFMDEQADRGDILSQRRIEISDTDDAASLYQKMTETALQQMKELTLQLQQGTYSRIPQPVTGSNTWRKRGQEDGRIDWRMSNRSIYNLIRGLTRPYPGAHFKKDNKDIKVWKSEIITNENYPNLEPGKVIRVENKSVVVKCGEGLIRLLDHEMTELPKVGDYL